MRVQIVDVTPGLNRDGSPDTYSAHGSRPYFITGTALEDVPAERIATDGEVHFKGNFKNPPVPGTIENFAFSMKDDGSGRAKVMGDDHTFPGKTVWRLIVSRAKDMSAGGNPYNGGGQRTPAPQSSPQRAANAPQTPSRHVPTMSQAVAVLRECVAAVEGWGSDAHATTLFLGRLRGDIVRDPSPAEAEAAKAKAQADAAAAAEAARVAAEAAQAAAAAAAAKAPGYAPSDGPDDDIPFAFLLPFGITAMGAIHWASTLVA